MATELKLVDEDRFDFCWIVDFPMFEFNEEVNHVDFSHNPFSMPQGELEALDSQDPLALAWSIRHRLRNATSHARALCETIAHGRTGRVAGLRDRRRLQRSGRGGRLRGMSALAMAPCRDGGLARIDRIVMLLAGQQAIREVIAFPLNQQGQDSLMNAWPRCALKELHIRVQAPPKV